MQKFFQENQTKTWFPCYFPNFPTFSALLVDLEDANVAEMLRVPQRKTRRRGRSQSDFEKFEIFLFFLKKNVFLKNRSERGERDDSDQDSVTRTLEQDADDDYYLVRQKILIFEWKSGFFLTR